MSEQVKKRKKVCSHCGRKLWLRDFYPKKGGGVSSWCKECEKQNKREWYERLHRVPDGIRQDPRTGRLIQYEGLAHRIFWNKWMLDTLKRLFATTKNEDLKEIIGVSERTLIRKARELGLQKNREWQHANSMNHLRMANLKNKISGVKSPFKKGVHYCPENEFKPGHTETPEAKAKRIAALKEWYKRHPKEVMERARKIAETRKRNKEIKQNGKDQQSQGQQ